MKEGMGSIHLSLRISSRVFLYLSSLCLFLFCMQPCGARNAVCLLPLLKMPMSLCKSFIKITQNHCCLPCLWASNVHQGTDSGPFLPMKISFAGSQSTSSRKFSGTGPNPQGFSFSFVFFGGSSSFHCLIPSCSSAFLNCSTVVLDLYAVVMDISSPDSLETLHPMAHST